MPMYEYRCASGHKSEGFNPMSKSAEPQLCPSCGQMAERIISPVRVFGDYPAYQSPATGAWVEGRRARTEDLRRSGCRPYEDGERETAALRTAAAERELDKNVDEAVERTFAEIK